uniref:FBD domain-containing protein n=1 Tax=Lactuca sativa TaxID=4236 RepID=A0A9R1WNI9_LACSA|nr:hypothetical protein LSAT_V11C100032690 [Lactuca sativa]
MGIRSGLGQDQCRPASKELGEVARRHRSSLARERQVKPAGESVARLAKESPARLAKESNAKGRQAEPFFPIPGIHKGFERINIANMLSNFPKIELLSIDGDSLEDVIEENMPKWLPYPVKSLKCLNLQDMQLRELCQLLGVLCLLRNSPNVEILWIELWGRQTVEMTDFGGSRLEILFINLLLAHSPSLKMFKITPRGAWDVDIGKDVM